jgi:hypothetical protein
METEDINFLLSKITNSTHFLIISENEANGKIEEWRKPFLVISNTDPSWLSGEHWVSFYFPKHDLPEFFDSYGHPPEYYCGDFVSFLTCNSYKRSYVYNQWHLQSSQSNVCGLYCILFALSKCHQLSFPDFLFEFDPFNPIRNDLKCIHLVESNFKVKLNVH